MAVPAFFSTVGWSTGGAARQRLLNRMLSEFPFLWAINQNWSESGEVRIQVHRLKQRASRNQLIKALSSKPFRQEMWVGGLRSGWPYVCEVELDTKKRLAESLNEVLCDHDMLDYVVIRSSKSDHVVADEYVDVSTFTIFFDPSHGVHVLDCVDEARG